MRNATFRYYSTFSLVLGALMALALLVSCGSNTTMTSSGTGTVTTNLTDPPTCGGAPGGQFANVWVTITKVTANINGDAGSSDGGWVTLVDLTSAPKQLDLLNLASTTCILTQLGSTT